MSDTTTRTNRAKRIAAKRAHEARQRAAKGTRQPREGYHRASAKREGWGE